MQIDAGIWGEARNQAIFVKLASLSLEKEKQATKCDLL